MAMASHVLGLGLLLCFSLGAATSVPDGCAADEGELSSLLQGRERRRSKTSEGCSPDQPGYVTISAIQGNGSATPIIGQEVVAIGVVTSPPTADQTGFFMQDSGDGDSTTSDGIYVYSTVCSPALGDLIAVRGIAGEHYDQTQISHVTRVTHCGEGQLPEPLLIQIPTRKSRDDVLEPLEGMLVKLDSAVIVDTYFLGEEGEAILGDSRPSLVPSQLVDPQSEEHATMYEDLRDTLLVDNFNVSGLDYSHPLRVGYTLSNVVGALSYTYSNYKIVRTVGLPQPVLSATNPRKNLTELGGSLTISSFNVMNYFNGPDWEDSRGATSYEEFWRQRNKTVSALTAIGADIFVLLEVQNNGFNETSAIRDLVDTANEILDPSEQYDFVIPTGYGANDRLGTDAIAVQIIFKPAKVAVVGTVAVMNATVDPMFVDTKNRPSVAATFKVTAPGKTKQVTVVANHLKSKGSSCEECCNDPEIFGVGNCNGVRTNATTALGNWLKKDPTGESNGDELFLGDLNSYHMESPIQNLINSFGYTDMVDKLHGKEHSWSYVYKGLAGYLDYILASPALVEKVKCAQEWHLNADEMDEMDFHSDNPARFYGTGPWRSSDHDPLVIALW